MVGKLMLQISGLLLALCPTINASPKDEFHRTIQTVKRSIAAVACLRKESDRNVSIASIEGTGFFISRDGVFLTAGHIAHGLYLGSPPRQKACEIPAIYVPKKRWGKAKETNVEIELRWFKIDRCVYDDNLNLAKCKLVQNPFTSPDVTKKPLIADLDTSLPEEGTSIAFTGFPLNTFQPVTARAEIGSYRVPPNEAAPSEVVVDHSSGPGASGAPIYLSNGKVVGIVLKRGLKNEAYGLVFSSRTAFIKSSVGDYFR